MEITELNLIGDFEAGMKCLQNPSLFSRFSPLSSIDRVPQFYSFWKWGALILAICATFTSVINRIKLLIHQIRVKSIASCQQSCSHHIYEDDDFDFDFSDDDDDIPSSVAESDDEEDYQKPADEVFRAEGSSCYWGRGRGQDGNLTLRHRNGFSWSDFSAGKSVVQLWDSFGLGLDFEDDSDNESEIVIWDLDRDVKISSGRQWQVPAAAGSSANVVLTAQMNDEDGIGLGAYDARVDSKAPAIYAAWRPRQRKVYVKGNGVGVENVTDLDGEMWWDADGVISEKEE